MTTWSVMSDVPNPIIVDAAGTAGSGYVLKAFLPGTTTSTSIAIDSSGASPQATITANSEGKWEVSGNEILPYMDRTHKWGIFANAADATANTPFYMGPFDNVAVTISNLEILIPIDTVALMISREDLVIGNSVETLGYISEGDGGNNIYKIVPAGTFIADNGSVIDLTGSGLQAKGLFPDGVVNINQFGADPTGGVGINPAVDAAMAFSGIAKLVDGSIYLLSAGEEVVIPAGGGLSGPNESIQGVGVTFTRAATDYTSFFVTDETNAGFSGIVLENFKITGASSSTFNDVANKWAITSHYPFTQIRNIAIEHNSDFIGNGVRLHNDGGQGSMGCWSSEITNVRYVGTTGIPDSNDQIGFDLKINGGQCKFERISATRCDIGIWAKAGEDLEFINCNLDNIKSGSASDRSKAALVIGEENTRTRVKALSFTGYIEGVGRAVVIQNCTSARIGGYMDALRAFAPDSSSDDGFIYINSTAKNTRLFGDIASQYNAQSVIYSESVYSTEDIRLFRNVSDSTGVPQPRFAGNVFGGILPSREVAEAFRLDDAESFTAITAMTASGSEIQVTAVAHGLVDDEYIWLEGAIGVTEGNNRLWQVNIVDVDNITLDGSKFDGTYTSGGNVWVVTQSLDGGEINRQVTYDPPSLGTKTGTTTTMSAPGAVVGDFVQVGFSQDLDGIILTGYVSTAGTVSARFFNSAGTTRDLASGTLSARVTKPTIPV